MFKITTFVYGYIDVGDICCRKFMLVTSPWLISDVGDLTVNSLIQVRRAFDSDKWYFVAQLKRILDKKGLRSFSSFASFGLSESGGQFWAFWSLWQDKSKYYRHQSQRRLHLRRRRTDPPRVFVWRAFFFICTTNLDFVSWLLNVLKFRIRTHSMCTERFLNCLVHEAVR